MTTFTLKRKAVFMEKLTIEISNVCKVKLGILKATSKQDFKQLVDEALGLLFNKYNVEVK